MKISTELLRKGLASKYSFEILGPVGVELLLTRMMFLCDQAAISDSCIYLSDGSQTLQKQLKRTDSVLLCTGKPQDSLTDAFTTIFIFDSAISLMELHNKIQGIFAFYEKWDATLQNILNRGGGVQKMIDCSAEIFENPMLLHNKSFAIIARSSTYQDAVGSETKGNFVNVDLEATKRDEEFNKTYTNVRADIFPAHLTGARTLYMNLFFQGRYEYRILVIESGRELCTGDGPLLEHLAYYIKLAISTDKTESTAEVMTLPHVLKSILNGTISDPYYIELKLNEYDWHGQQSYFCMKLMVDILDIQNHTLGLHCDNIVSLMPGSCAFDYENSIVVYVNLDMFGGNAEASERKIIYYLRDNNLKAGISDEFTGIGDFNLYHRQAELALTVGLRNKPHIWIHRFRNITELFLLQSCTSQLPARMVCAPELLILEKYDGEHDTDYYRTLRVFIKNNMHHIQTSRELFIHRSTLIYRLERIKTLTGSDIEDPNRQWYLQLSFKLYAEKN